MPTAAFLRELDGLKQELLRKLTASGSVSLDAGASGSGADMDGQIRLLQIALANEINVSELAALWMPSTPEVDVKIALARQAGDEARHFQLVGDRLKEMGFDPAVFVPPAQNPLFDYLKSLETSVERIAAGLYTLESIAYEVNENFMRLCSGRGDEQTLRLYRDFIQPDEEAHQRLGGALLRAHATTPALQSKARAAVLKTIEISETLRAKAAERIGTPCFPGC
jgi:uncharacterized ferritin-like protein (DUF455 family)